jgi:hypothetical protein
MSDSRHNNGPVFIVGAPRSGTTMLQYRLRNHSRISLPTGESHFFIPLCRNADKFGDLSRVENVRLVLAAMYEQSSEFLDSDLHGIKFDIDRLAGELHEENRDTIPAIISGVFKKNARGEGKLRWGDKTPYYVLHMPSLLEWFPDAQIVHIIRDGRDVALSLFGRRHDFRVYNIYHAAKYWQQYVEVGCEAGARLGPKVYMEVRFENILRDPTGVFKRICAFLGEEYDDKMFDLQPVDDPGKTPLVHQAIKEENKEKWRHEMTSRQIRIFEAAAGDTLERLGYYVKGKSRRLPLPSRVFYRAHNSMVNVFWNRKLGR